MQKYCTVFDFCDSNTVRKSSFHCEFFFACVIVSGSPLGLLRVTFEFISILALQSTFISSTRNLYRELCNL
jgi:hypothetical protein